MILVTRATGENGMELLKLLLAHAVDTRAMLRDPGKARGPA
jgi:uncharacterized protein YbjT (DUF2867 family)